MSARELRLSPHITSLLPPLFALRGSHNDHRVDKSSHCSTPLLLFAGKWRLGAEVQPAVQGTATVVARSRRHQNGISGQNIAARCAAPLTTAGRPALVVVATCTGAPASDRVRAYCFFFLAECPPFQVASPSSYATFARMSRRLVTPRAGERCCAPARALRYCPWAAEPPVWSA